MLDYDRIDQKKGLASVHPKYEPTPLDKHGERNAQLEPWQKQHAEIIKESKSVGKPLKVREPKMPEAGALEPVKGDAFSIQAVSAARLPPSTLKGLVPASDPPTYQTKMKNVMNYKYVNHTKPEYDPKRVPIAVEDPRQGS